MKGAISIIYAFRDLLLQLLPSCIRKIFFKERDIAFIVHPLNYKDAVKKYPFAKFFSDKIIEKWMKIYWPIIGSPISSFNSSFNKEVKGWIIICPLTPKLMVLSSDLAKKKIFYSVRFAEKLGCRIAGLGAFTSILTRDGLELIDKIKNIGLTTGNTYAAALIIQNIKEITKRLQLSLKDLIVAIVGAAGSVGSACSKILSPQVKEIVLIDINYPVLKNMAQELRGKIKLSSEINMINKADLVVAVTSTPGAIINSKNLKSGCIVIDAAQPKNVSEDILREREDVLVIDSGIVKVENIKYDLDLGLKENEVFACLGEIIALSLINWKGHYSLGKAEPRQVEEISIIAEKAGFLLADFRNSKRMIDEEEISRFKNFLNTKLKNVSV